LSPAEVLTAQRLRDGIERIKERQRLNRLQAEVVHMSRVSAMGAMASTIAHELNQPLTASRNYLAGCKLLVRSHGGEAAELLSEAIEKAADQTLRAGEIVRHLRQLVAKGEAATAPHRVAELVEDASSLALLDAARLGVACEVAIDEDATQVMADDVQVQQVMINLIRNALEAMSDEREKRLLISARSAGAEVEIGVEDSGPGVAPEVLPGLFNAFSSSKSDGLGVGLSISRTIIEAHGGRIWAEPSAALGGARFAFTLRKAPPLG